jgi:stage V sporulation protein AE
MKRDVILVTDGDNVARKAIEKAASNIGGRCISRSAGNPTLLSGADIVEYIKQAKHDPVVVMVDDMGNSHTGSGEKAMDYIINSEYVNILGVVAVASNTEGVEGIKADCCVDRECRVTKSPVNKDGIAQKRERLVIGDTVDILNDERVPIIVGVGDPGKMEGYDDVETGAPVITKALQEIIKYNKSMVR